MAEFVTVGCKLRHGFDMQLVVDGKMETIHLKGNVNSLIVDAGGFGITPKVPKAFWDEWQKQHKLMPFVKQGLIFAHVDPNYVEDKGQEHAELKHGVEQLDPSVLPRRIDNFVNE